jgi:hypothetical protein
MSDQQVPGFYAVGDEDTFLVSLDGQVFEVVRGGMEGPVLARVDALPPGELHVMDGALILPSLLLQAARMLDIPSPLRDLSIEALDVLDEVLWGGPVGADVAHVDALRRGGLLVVERDRARLSPDCQRQLSELSTAICGRPFAASAGEQVVA